jgi:hypothetical protein
VRDEGLAFLKGLSGVEELFLFHNHDRVSDLSCVTGMKRLKCLSLEETGVSDDALKSLREVTSLEELLTVA